MNPNNGIILVAGGTGRTGYFIVKELLSSGFQVRLITKNRNAAELAFNNDLIQIESVFECDLFFETKQQKPKLDTGKEVRSLLELAFEPTRKGEKVQAFISALSIDMNSNDDSRILEETSIKLLAGLCKKHKVQQFVLLSSCLVNHPFHPSAFFANTFERNTISNKVGAENILRESGLNYIIVRPGALKGNKQQQNTPTNYQVSQGGQLTGSINRATLGKIIVESLMDQTLPQKVTFECISTAQQLSEGYQKFDGKDLKEDNENSILRVNHQSAATTYKIVILSLITLTFGVVYKLFF